MEGPCMHTVHDPRGGVPRPGRDPPHIRPQRVDGDQGHGNRQMRACLRRHEIRYTILRKKNERHKGPFDRAVSRSCNQVERSINNRLKQFRRIATQYEIACPRSSGTVRWTGKVGVCGRRFQKS